MIFITKYVAICADIGATKCNNSKLTIEKCCYIIMKTIFLYNLELIEMVKIYHLLLRN